MKRARILFFLFYSKHVVDDMKYAAHEVKNVT